MIFPSCSKDDGSGYVFKMNIENNPRNLDPQLAEDSESLMIITNMMEGLMKINSSGAIVTAAAESFEMSDNGLTYTFYLKKNQKWDTAADFTAEVTADDFVFAFQRIFDKKNESPYSDEYMCIKNATSVFNGTASYNELGVKAVDKYTVEFTLEYPYYDFLNLLAQTPAMPCNREFFEFTKGKYGMSANTTSSNGAFYLKEWNFDPYWDNNYIIMRRNISYSDSNYVYPYSLNFFITGVNNNDKDDFAENKVQCFLTDKFDKKIFEENNYTAYQTGTVGLVFNSNSEYLSNYQIREALAKSINRESYEHFLPDSLSTAFGILPSRITMQGKSYREMSPDRTLSTYDINSASLWENALKALGKNSVDGIKITVSDSFESKELIYSITEQWQEKLLFYCGVEVVSQVEYNNKINDGTYDIALVEFKSSQNSASDFLYNFVDSKYFSAYTNSDLTSQLKKARNAASLTEAVDIYTHAEKSIIDSYMFVPLYYSSEYFVTNSNSKGLIYYPFTSSVWFGEAKYFE